MEKKKRKIESLLFYYLLPEYSKTKNTQTKLAVNINLATRVDRMRERKPLARYRMGGEEEDKEGGKERQNVRDPAKGD